LHIDRTNAERQRRYRMRQTGLLCSAAVEVSYSIIVALVERGYLEGGASKDPVCRARAIEQFLKDQLKR